MTDFDRWLSFAVGDSETEPGGEEGGWNPTDPSPKNPTWRGIEYNEACAWFAAGGYPGTMSFDAFRANTTRTAIGTLAFQNYWQKFHVALLPSGPNILYMDGVFNGGGVENLQTAMNGLLGAGLTIDNELGPATLAAMKGLAAIPAQQIIASYTLAAQARYRALGRPEDLAGWLGRLGRGEALALQLTGGGT